MLRRNLLSCSEIQNAHLERKDLQWQSSSHSDQALSSFVLLSSLSQDQRALWGDNSWLRLVGNSCFESSFGSLGWISFWLALWPLREAEKLLCGFAKIRKTKTISSVDSSISGPDGSLAWDLCAEISVVDILVLSVGEPPRWCGIRPSL